MAKCQGYIMSKKILSTKLVLEKTRQCRATLYAKINKDSRYYDPSFPQPVRLSARSVGWFEHEVDAWLDSRDRGVSTNTIASLKEV